MTAPTLSARIRGGILGTLVGDALGVPVEFNGRASLDLAPVTGMRGHGTWNQPAGTWSDDGAMTLVVADVLAHHGWEPERMMAGFQAWLDEGLWSAHGAAFDVGNATRNAIMQFRILGDWTSCGQGREGDNGNGSLMRCFPASAWLAGISAQERTLLAGEASSLTHAHIRSRLCCAWHAQWCEAMLADVDVRRAGAQASALLRRHVPESERRALARIMDGSVLDLERGRVASDGYVVSTLEAALWCLGRHGNFADSVLAAVNLGGDTDTTGAVAGGMAGWAFGAEAIPEAWLAALPRRDEVEKLAGDFAEACQAQWARGGQQAGG